MSDAKTIAEGRAAWARIRDRSKRQAEDWFLVGDALVAGRSECLKLAGSNSLHTPAYRAHWRRWLDANGFGDMDGHERLNAMWVAEHKAEVTRWREGLDEAARRHANHPNVIVQHMRDGTLPAPRGPKRQAHIVQPDRRTNGGQYVERLTRPGQDLIRRVAHAMRESGKADWIALATIAIETLTVEDLRDLMPAKVKLAAFQMELHA